jgi:hypothetical protein
MYPIYTMAKVHPSIFVLLAVFVAVVAAGVYAFPAIKETFGNSNPNNVFPTVSGNLAM